MDKLHRTRLLFGDNAVTRLQESTVMVVGCGAVGSFAIEALARTGIGHIIVVDFDTVEPSNINRQLFATSTQGHGCAQSHPRYQPRYSCHRIKHVF